jgi:ABC-type lipoprotein export system ATPase subunit
MKVHVHELRHLYRGAQVEDRLVLEIETWEVGSGVQLLLRGISGSGKTTLLNILAGLLPPTQGRVYIGEQSLYALPEAQRDRLRAQRIGYVFQTHMLVATLSALENVEMPLVFGGERRRAERRRRATALLEQVGLGEFARHRPVQLSTGQRLRVAIARALVSRPQLLLADEPTAALDPTNAISIMDLMQACCREVGTTLVVASHDPALAIRFDRVCDLRLGRLVDQAEAAAPAVAHMPQVEMQR